MPPTPHADSALSGIPDGSQIDAFADALWLEEGLARNTLDAYRRDLIALVRWLAPHCKGLLQVQEADLQAYFAYRHAQTRATTANRRLTVFKRFFGWALRERLVAQDPTLRLQAAREQDHSLGQQLATRQAHLDDTRASARAGRSDALARLDAELETLAVRRERLTGRHALLARWHETRHSMGY